MRGRVLLLFVGAALSACAASVDDEPEVDTTTGDVEELSFPADTASIDPSLIDRPLEGTEWVLVSVFGQVVPDGTQAVISFDRELERISGNTGCNAFTGAWELAGTRLQLSGVGMTRMACPPGLDQLEVDLMEAFRTTGSFRINLDVLELMSEMGPVARYRARDGS